MKRKVIIWGNLKIHQSLCSSLLGMFLRRDVYISSTEFHTNQSSWSNSRQIFPDRFFQTKLYLLKLPHRTSSPSSCISGTAWLIICEISLLLQQQTGKVFWSQLTRVWRRLLGELVNSIQLSPKGEVNSGGYIPRHDASRYISSAVHRPWGG